MSRIEIEGAPEHVSHSSFETYITCPTRWYLRKVAHVDERPMFAGLGGSAVHAASEDYDLGRDGFDPASSFYKHFGEQVEKTEGKSGWSIKDWIATGKPTKQFPNKNDGEWWLHHGPQFVQSYVAWRERTNWEIWTAPTGEFGVEMELNFTLPDGPKIKGFIDRVFILPNGDAVVVDIKTSARQPEQPIQLGLYATGVELTYQGRPQWGSYWASRKWSGMQAGDHTELAPLYNWSPERLTALYNQFIEKVNEGDFSPKPGYMCKSCTVAYFCSEVPGGEPADLASQQI